ncbi:hypothetical protein DEU56DRAFT_915683 [Suillus clintonianus]|uniref:uncharacterized protein n=1 Tax=Suillus clintonianus TaxID=1904413 RepID=UPI001B87806A|nr:uncharacterized protein DEU56DRAFT_915683 [Suillus clintonianus]KAG2127710.1 hypothetical protein DEU56DRAFT_915683 [Suillus clintonianus]
MAAISDNSVTSSSSPPPITVTVTARIRLEVATACCTNNIAQWFTPQGVPSHPAHGEKRHYKSQWLHSHPNIVCLPVVQLSFKACPRWSQPPNPGDASQVAPIAGPNFRMAYSQRAGPIPGGDLRFRYPAAALP